jgi:hypothetical protein
VHNFILYIFMPSLNKQLANLENKSILNYLLKLIVIRQKFQASYSWRECVILVHMLQSQCTQQCHHVCLFGSVWGNIVPGMYSVFFSLLEILCINFARYGQNIIHTWLKWNGKTVSMIWFVVIMATLWQKLHSSTFVCLLISYMCN